jgi:hypothetical protein
MSATMHSQRPRAYDPDQTSLRPSELRAPSWDLGTERRIDDGRTLARAIGWFSIGLGALELLAPDRVSEFLGMEDRKELIRLYGLREAAKGLGILSQRTPTKLMWARVAGDFLDLATLATALGDDNPNRHRVVAAMGAVAGVTVLDVICARQLSEADQISKSHRHYSTRYHDAPGEAR